MESLGRLDALVEGDPEAAVRLLVRVSLDLQSNPVGGETEAQLLSAYWAGGRFLRRCIPILLAMGDPDSQSPTRPLLSLVRRMQSADDAMRVLYGLALDGDALRRRGIEGYWKEEILSYHLSSVAQPSAWIEDQLAKDYGIPRESDLPQDPIARARDPEWHQYYPCSGSVSKLPIRGTLAKELCEVALSCNSASIAETIIRSIELPEQAAQVVLAYLGDGRVDPPERQFWVDCVHSLSAGGKADVLSGVLRPGSFSGDASTIVATLLVIGNYVDDFTDAQRVGVRKILEECAASSVHYSTDLRAGAVYVLGRMLDPHVIAYLHSLAATDPALREKCERLLAGIWQKEPR